MSDPTAPELATIPCNLCGGTEVSVLSRVSRSGRPLRSVCCRGCGLVWADPRAHDPRQFYAEDYRLAYKQTFEPRRKHVLRAGQVALDRYRRIRHRLGAAGLRVLDVGSGGGEFAHLMQSRGHRVTGIEPNRGYGEYSRREYGLEVIEGFAGDGGTGRQQFDLATIWHVLEHTENPCGVLSQLREALRPGGTLVVEVPNIEATCQSPRSSFHEAHIYTFSPATLTRMAHKAGLQVVELTHSADGGNITAVMKPLADALPGSVGPEPARADWRLPGEHERVSAIVRGHTALRHFFSAHPWRRAAGRLGRMVGEWWQTRDRVTGRALLDRLYAADALTDSLTDSPPAWRWTGVTLGATVAAYAVAVGAEEMLLDRPLTGIMAAQSAPLVFGVLLALIATALGAFMLRQLGRAATRARLAALIAPLALIPVVC